MTARRPGNGDGLYLRLEVLPGVSHDEIARAYRRLAHNAHPDAHPGDPDAARRFREITEAYEVLGNPDRREQYDRARRQAGVGINQPFPASGTSSPAPGRPPVFASPTATGDPIVFLGAGPVTKPTPGLFVGPVQVRPSRSGPPPSLTHEDVAAALLARLLSDLFEPRWRS
jgi:curved DNA-binding protein CbpA